MSRPVLLTPEQSMDATKGDIVIDTDGRALHVKLHDCNCRTPSPSPYNHSTFQCCWLSLRNLDMLDQLQQRIRNDVTLLNEVPLRQHPDILQLRVELDSTCGYHGSCLNRIDEELQMLKQQCAAQQEQLQRLLPSTVAVVEDGERKLQLQ